MPLPNLGSFPAVIGVSRLGQFCQDILFALMVTFDFPNLPLT